MSGFLKAAGDWADVTTETEHSEQLAEAIQTIRKDLDGYCTLAQGSDGYVAFFTGANALAGDGDLYYDRETGKLKIGGNDYAAIFHNGENAEIGAGTGNVKISDGGRWLCYAANWWAYS